MLEFTRQPTGALDVCPPQSHPNPQPDRQREDPRRDLDCRHYDDCLDRAVREGWPAFSCSMCPLMGKAHSGQLDVEAFVRRNDESDEAARPLRKPVKVPGMTPVVRAVLEACPERGTWGAPRVQSSLSTKYTLDQVRKALARLAAMGLLRRTSPGIYAHATTKKEGT